MEKDGASKTNNCKVAKQFGNLKISIHTWTLMHLGLLDFHKAWHTS